MNKMYIFILNFFDIFRLTFTKEERQDILDKKKEIRLKRKNRKKAILLNIA